MCLFSGMMIMAMVVCGQSVAEMPADLRAQIDAQFIGDWTWEVAFGDDKYQGEESFTWAGGKAWVVQRGYALVDGQKESYECLIGWRSDEKALVFSAHSANGDYSVTRWTAFSSDGWTGEGSGIYMGKPWKSPAKLDFKGDLVRYEDTTDGKPWVKILRRKQPAAQTEVKVPEAVLAEMEYLVGEWETEGTVLGRPHTGTATINWVPGKHCLISNATSNLMTATAIVGWDPATNEIVETWYRTDGVRIEQRIGRFSKSGWEGTSTLHDASGKIRHGTIRVEKALDGKSFTYSGGLEGATTITGTYRRVEGTR